MKVNVKVNVNVRVKVNVNVRVNVKVKGGGAGSHGADGGSGADGVGEFGARESEEGEQAIDVDPAGVRVVVGKIEFVGLAREGEAFDEAHAAVDAREAAAVVFDPTGDDFPAEGGARGLEPADERGIEGSAERINIMDEERAELRAGGEEAGERAVFQEVRDFEPVTDWVEALAGKIIRVVGTFAGVARPVGERDADAVAHFLFLFVEFLLGGFLPREGEVAHSGNETEADGAAGGKENGVVEG